MVRRLDQSFKDGRNAHAYLITGPPQVGKRTLALNMAQAVNCLSPDDAPCGHCNQCTRIAAAQHPDVVVLPVQKEREDGPPRTGIGIDEVRDVQHLANLKPYEGRCRVFILDGAEHMSEEASNALLKTLEEPPPQVMIILLGCLVDELLPTILSRCRRLELGALPLDQVAAELVRSSSADAGEADRLARLSSGRMGWAIIAAADPSILQKRNEELERIGQIAAAPLEERFAYASELATLCFRNRESATEVLNLWLSWWRDLLLAREGHEGFLCNVDWSETLSSRAGLYTMSQLVGFIRAIFQTLDSLEQNVNPRLALEMLMLEIPGQRTSASSEASAGQEFSGQGATPPR